MCKGQLITIAGHPAEGKTSSAVMIAAEEARAGNKSIFFGVELVAESYFNRMITKINASLNEERIIADNTIHEDVDSLLSKMECAVREKGVNRVFIDCCDWIISHERVQKDEIQEGLFSRLKEFASKHDVIIYATCNAIRRVKCNEADWYTTRLINSKAAVKYSDKIYFVRHRNEKPELFLVSKSNSPTVEQGKETYKGCFSMNFAPKQEEDYVPRNYDEECICNGLRLLSDGKTEEGLKKLQNAWADENLWAGELLSYGYTANWFGENDYPKALQILYKMESRGSGMAMNNLGTMYMEGSGVKRSDRWAKYWLEKSVAHGCVYAMINLANMLTIGPKKYRDYARAVELLKMAMDKDDPEAFNMMGICYHEGRGVPQSNRKAFQYYKLGYEKGAGPAAAYNLGKCYYFGRGVKKDTEKAEILFKEAEEGGFPVKYELNKK